MPPRRRISQKRQNDQVASIKQGEVQTSQRNAVAWLRVTVCDSHRTHNEANPEPYQLRQSEQTYAQPLVSISPLCPEYTRTVCFNHRVDEVGEICILQPIININSRAVGTTLFNPFRTPVPFWGQGSQIPSNLSPITPKTRLQS